MVQPRATSVERKRKKRKPFLGKQLPPGTLLRTFVLWMAFPAVCLVVMAILVDGCVMPLVTRHGTEFTLPDFTGQRVLEARLTLEDLDLNHEVATEEYSASQEKGVILSQIPIGGTKVKSDRIIKFVVSRGQRVVAVPDVAGLSVRQALLNLETAGLELGDITWAFNDTLPERLVVVSYPPAGTELSQGSPVTLMVNRGRAADFTYVPPLVGLPLEEATRRLEDKQLQVGIITPRLQPDLLPETVVEQSEAEGTEVELGTSIDLVVSVEE